MKSLFGIIHLGKLIPEQQRHQDLLKQLRKIMATQAEIAAQLRAITDQLTAANSKLAGAATQLAKVGTETDSLNQRINDLEEAVNNQTGASQELVDAFTALKTQADAQGNAISGVETAITAVDDKVPDAQPPTT